MSKTLAAPPPSDSEEDEEEDNNDEDDDEEEEDNDPTPAPNRIRKHANDVSGVAGIREAARRVSEVSFTREDSIMDSSDDEDADEVDDLL